MLEHLKEIITDTLQVPVTLSNIEKVTTRSKCLVFNINPFTFYMYPLPPAIILDYGMSATLPQRRIIPFYTTQDLEIIIPYYLNLVQYEIDQLFHLLPLSQKLRDQLHKAPQVEILEELQLYPQYLETTFKCGDINHIIRFEKEAILFNRMRQYYAPDTKFHPSQEKEIKQYLTQIIG